MDEDEFSILAGFLIVCMWIFISYHVYGINKNISSIENYLNKGEEKCVLMNKRINYERQ